jgi:hypothetical protein
MEEGDEKGLNVLRGSSRNICQMKNSKSMDEVMIWIVAIAIPNREDEITKGFGRNFECFNQRHVLQ